MRWSIRLLPLTLALLVITSCGSASSSGIGPTSSAEESPNETAASTPESSAAASTSVERSPAVDATQATGLRPDTYAEVVTDDLRVRTQPGTSSDAEALDPLLQEGVPLLVVDGPVRASDYDWYQVLPLNDPESEGDYPFGWVAAADTNGEPWIEPTSVPCPPSPVDVEDFLFLRETTQLYEVTCFGGQDFTFQARLISPEGLCGLEAQWGVDPEWFDSCRRAAYYLAPLGTGVPENTLNPVWAPDVDFSIAPDPQASPADWPTVEVTAQFDHPDARSCRNRLNEELPEAPEPDPALTVLFCRADLVISSMREVD